MNTSGLAGGRRILLEICVDSAAGATAALVGGADRLELCSALDVGGLTPSAGLTATVCAQARARGIPVFAMVRPRSGDFAYDADEWAQATVEALALLDQGVDGLVLGAAVDGRLPHEPLRRWVEDVRGHVGRHIPCTFHRAIDVLDDPIAAVDAIAALGFERVLTSGAAVRAVDGAATIAAMVDRAGDRVAIMAGAGVTADNVAALVDAGAAEIHASASRPEAMPAPELVRLGFAAGPRRTTDTGLVCALRARLDALYRRP